MGGDRVARHAGRMTTSTITTPAPAHVGVHADPTRLLALAAPLLLFLHGILIWLDGLGAGDAVQGTDTAATFGSGPGDASMPSSSVLAVLAGAVLVLCVACFAGLGTALAGRSQRTELAVPVALLGAFGAGATAAVWVGRSTAWLVDPLPAGLAVGGAVLTGLALALSLVTLAAEGRMPFGSLALSGGAAALLVLPYGLEPLGALLLV